MKARIEVKKSKGEPKFGELPLIKSVVIFIAVFPLFVPIFIRYPKLIFYLSILASWFEFKWQNIRDRLEFWKAVYSTIKKLKEHEKIQWEKIKVASKMEFSKEFDIPYEEI